MGKIENKRLMQKNSQFRHGNNGKLNTEVKKKPRFSRGCASQLAAQQAKASHARSEAHLSVAIEKAVNLVVGFVNRQLGIIDDPTSDNRQDFY